MMPSNTNRHPILIIGAGLTGLTTAYRLRQAGMRAAILEARNRLGGRIHTLRHQDATLEMGATWLGEKHRHLIHLLKELGLKTFPQVTGATAIYEQSADQPAERVPLPPNPEPSLRIEGGSSRLINALAEQLDEAQIWFGQDVQSIQLEKDQLQVRTKTNTFHAPTVITTLPPKLLVDTIEFHPNLPEELTTIAESTHTWMGESIKAGLIYEAPFWKSNGSTGTLFSNAGPFLELFDHSNVQGTAFALKGFLKEDLFDLSPEQRQEKTLRQLERYYGAVVRQYLAYEECVWRDESYTFTPYGKWVLPHQHNGHPVFRNGYSDNRLWIAGSETAAAFPGYMEGAVQRGEELAKLMASG